MNRYLCVPDAWSANFSTADEFFQTTGFISTHILPVVALAGNSLILLVILTNSQLNSSSFSVYVKCMAVSDTLVLVLKLLSFENKTSKMFYWPKMCTGLVFLSEVSVLLSTWTIVLITIERALVVVYPLHIKKFVSASRARKLILGIAMCSTAIAARMLVIPMETSDSQRNRCHPAVGWHHYERVNGTITVFLTCFIPLFIVMTGNCITLYTVRRAIFQRQEVLTNRTYSQKRTLETNENQLMLMLLMVTLMFMVYFVPYAITTVIIRWGLPFGLCFTNKGFDSYLYIRGFSELLKDLNFCTNFIIYCISGRRFRYAFFSLLRRRSDRSLSHKNGQESSRNRTEGIMLASMRRPCNSTTTNI